MILRVPSTYLLHVNDLILMLYHTGNILVVPIALVYKSQDFLSGKRNSQVLRFSFPGKKILGPCIQVL